MKRSLMMAAALTAVLVLALAAPVTAKKGGTDRPIKGDVTGTSEVSGAAPTFAVDSHGMGQISHLGRTHSDMTTSQTWGADGADLCPGSSIVADVTGNVTFTAANGDELDAVVGGYVCETAPFNDTAYAANLALTFAGGTGRFADASGSASLVGTSVWDTGAMFLDSGTLNGAISY